MAGPSHAAAEGEQVETGVWLGLEPSLPPAVALRLAPAPPLTPLTRRPFWSGTGTPAVGEGRAFQFLPKIRRQSQHERHCIQVSECRRVECVRRHVPLCQAGGACPGPPFLLPLQGPAWPPRCRPEPSGWSLHPLLSLPPA